MPCLGGNVLVRVFDVFSNLSHSYLHNSMFGVVFPKCNCGTMPGETEANPYRVLALEKALNLVDHRDIEVPLNPCIDMFASITEAL